MNYSPLRCLYLLMLVFLSCTFTNFAQDKNIQTQSMELQILSQINAARENPQSFIPYLEDYKKHLNGRIISIPNHGSFITFEGAVAIDEAIEYLKKAEKVQPMRLSDGLLKPAKLQLSDLLENSSLGHKGKNGSSLPQRISTFGSFGANYAESITYSATDARDIVLMMIIDDGNKRRGHRANLFNKFHLEVGIAFGTTSKEAISVSVFANFFRPYSATKTIQLPKDAKTAKPLN